MILSTSKRQTALWAAQNRLQNFYHFLLHRPLTSHTIIPLWLEKIINIAENIEMLFMPRFGIRGFCRDIPICFAIHVDHYHHQGDRFPACLWIVHREEPVDISPILS